MRRIRPGSAAMGALTCACVVATGCGATETGARKEGPAPSASVRRSSTAAAPAIARDPRALATMVRRDSSVSQGVREDLTPCAGDDYPMATDTGDLTEGDGPDLVVNVTTCGDGLGVAAYVYRMVNGKYQNVFADERPPVYGSVEDGQLQIIHEVYKVDDPVSYPTGQESVLYAWRDGRFVQVSRSYADFGASTPTVRPEPTSTDPAPRPDSDPLDPDLPTPKPTPTASAAPAR
ncbi:putative Lipoprotein CseA [Actinacidiphila bryophytorum]|uniref:Lipoprotein CseA n=2 Tax=Actinacidiphila bryophytorum TaxID=1436133 RepID=A0A9W4E1F1_9ACTN|nr:putative Lipoprotein CseA [Actinacidiphila bryophytorum]